MFPRAVFLDRPNSLFVCCSFLRMRLRADHFLFQHSVNKIEYMLALLWGGMGNAIAVEMGIATHQQLKADRIPFHFDPEIKGAAALMFFLGLGENFWWQNDPVETDHGTGLEVAFQVGVYIVPLHGGQIINDKLAHNIVSRLLG